MGHDEIWIERAEAKAQRETYLLALPQPRDSRPQFGSMVWSRAVWLIEVSWLVSTGYHEGPSRESGTPHINNENC